MSKLILYTKSGGVPYLNDTLISLLPYCYINFKFSDFITNLEVIEKYGNNRNNMLSDFFGIEANKSYVSLYHQNDFILDLGNSSNEKINVKAINGKSELKIEQYIKSLKILSPKLAIIPHEPVRIL